MAEHTRTDGLPAAAPDPAALGLDRAAPRNERMAAGKVECNACPVLCQISAGKTGACDRYANAGGTLVRVDPVVMLQRTLAAGEAAVVPFAGTETAADPLAGGREVFVTGIGAGTTYPDYKPAPFLVASQADGVDMVTVVTEGLGS